MYRHLENMILDYYYKKVNNAKSVLQQDSVNNYLDILYLLQIEYYYAPLTCKTNTDYAIRELWKNIEMNANIINSLP